MKFADVKNDVAFHKVFGSENKKISLISFLNAVLQTDGKSRIVAVTLHNPFDFSNAPIGKTIVMDIRATDEQGRHFLVEMQVGEKKGFEKRVQYYASRDYSAQIGRGEDYPALRPTYFIAILDFYFTQNPNYFSIHKTIDIVTGENLLQDIQYHFIELKKFNKKVEELEDMIDKWTFFIKNAEDLAIIPDNVNDEGLKEAYLSADRHTWSQNEIDLYIDTQVRKADIIQERLVWIEKAEEARKHADEAEKKLEEAKKELEEVQKQAEEVQKQAEEAQKQAEEVQKQAEEVQKQAEEAQKQAEKQKIDMIVMMFKSGLAIEQISVFAQKTIDDIKLILEKYK